MGRIVQSVAMSFVRGCFVRGLVTIYVFGVFIAYFLLPLRRMSRTPGADGTEIFLPFGIGAFFLVVLPAILAYFATRSRNARFDRLFGSLGLATFPYAFQYRRYEGTYGGRRFLAEPGVPARLARLLRFEGSFARRQLVLRPGALNVTFHLSTAFMSWIPSPAQVKDWANALVALAQIAERVPPPAVPIAPTRLEQQVGSIRGMGVALNPGAVALVTMLVTSLVIAAIAGIIVLSQKSCRPSRGPGSVA